MGTKWLTGRELAEAAEELVAGSVSHSTDVACYFKPEKLVETMEALRSSERTDFVFLTNLCAADYWERFEVVYHIQSFEKNQAACVKVELPDREQPSLPSVVSVWHGAWMQECEAYDLFGIRFEEHPNLYRILLWEGYPGWPLRKDFMAMPGGLHPGLDDHVSGAPRPEPEVRLAP